MLYSSALLMACKKINLVDASQPSLSTMEKNLYSYALQDAVSKFNNDRKINIGQERLTVTRWNSDPQGLGFFFKIVRSGTNNSENGPQEIPQRLNIAFTPNEKAGFGRDLWTILNEIDFEKTGEAQRVVCYTLYDNYGLLRTRMPSTITFVFDRSILYPQTTAPQDNSIDPLEVNVNMPSSHIPYFVNLIAYEIGLNQKVESWLLSKIEKALQEQYQALCSSNVTDRVKQPFTLRDRVRNCVISRAYS